MLRVVRLIRLKPRWISRSAMARDTCGVPTCIFLAAAVKLPALTTAAKARILCIRSIGGFWSCVRLRCAVANVSPQTPQDGTHFAAALAFVGLADGHDIFSPEV